MSVTINGTSGLVFNDASTQSTAATGFGFKNRLINSAMMIDQRNAGASVTITGTSVNQYVLDRFYLRASSATGSKVSVQRSTTAPAGFVNSQLITSLSSYTLGSSEHFGTTQAIEGFNIADLAWGTASASPITISFWVRSSLTGTFGGHITNSDSSNTYVYSYTINAANTWEYKTVTVSGATSGTWLSDNGVGLYLNFSVAAGSSLTRSAGSWGTFARSVTGQTSLVGTNGATFYITGVQLEKGSTATSFDYRPYGTELQLCQRYFAKLNNDGSGGDVTFGTGIQQQLTASAFTVVYPVTMRAEPSATAFSLEVSDMSTWSTAFTLGSISGGYTSCRIQGSNASNGAQFRPVFLRITTDTAGYLTFSAEL
jgi:hypothetical protein